MNGIEKIAQRIHDDAQAEIEGIKADAKAQADELLRQAQSQAQAEGEEILERGRQQAEERRQRLESAAQMERKKLLLGAKQAMVSQAFDLALEQLCSLPEQQYIDLLVKLARQATTTGKEQLIFSPADRAKVGKQVVTAINEALVKEVTPELPEKVTESKVGALLGKVIHNTSAVITGAGLLTLSEQTRPIRGGFIMVDGNVEINCAFETLVYLQREKLEREVAAVLFPN